MTQIITIANRKGGAGKSTCAAHFAMEASSRGDQVILIDLDPQKTLEGWWERREAANPYMADATVQNLKDKIDLIRNKNFKYCIIDTPGDTSINSIEAIKVADLVVIPCKPTAPDLKAIGRTISMVQEWNKNFVFLLTQTIPRSNAVTQAASVLSEFGHVAPSTISNRIAYTNAMSVGISASEIDKNAGEEIKITWDFITFKLNGIQEKEHGKEKI